MAIPGVLRQRISSLLATYLDDGTDGADLDPSVEPVAIRSGSAVVLVRLVDAEPPLVRVYSPVVRDVPSTPALLERLNELNSSINFVRIFWRDGTVFVASELLASLLDEPELAHACDAIGDLADYYDTRLRDEFGGTATVAGPV